MPNGIRAYPYKEIKEIIKNEDELGEIKKVDNYEMIKIMNKN